VRTVTETRAEKRRAIPSISPSRFCRHVCVHRLFFALDSNPKLIYYFLEYIVQGHRYNIFEDIGCLGETYETPVAVILFHLPMAPSPPSNVVRPLSLFPLYTPLTHLSFSSNLSTNPALNFGSSSPPPRTPTSA
jgi:hypothetical protein